MKKKNLRKTLTMLLAAMVMSLSIPGLGQVEAKSAAFWDGEFYIMAYEDGSVYVWQNSSKPYKSLVNAVIPSTVSHRGVTYNVTGIGQGAFKDCTSLESVVIPNGITTIGGDAFEGCTSLTSVAIPYGVTTIEPCTFERCTSLTNVTIPYSVTTIEPFAFEGCTSLTDIIIPDSVVAIGREAFKGCTKLSSAVIPDSVTTVGTSAFDDTKHKRLSMIIPAPLSSIQIANIKSQNMVNISDAVTVVRVKGSVDLVIREDKTVWKDDGVSFTQVPDIHDINYMIKDSGDGNRVYAFGENGTVWVWNGEKFIVNEDLSGAVYVAAGEHIKGKAHHEYQFKIMSDGSLWGKGDNDWGQLDTVFPTYEKKYYDDWVKVPVDNVKSIRIYGKNVTALKNDGTVWYWGLRGPMGAMEAVPTLAQHTITDVLQIIMAEDYKIYALTNDGTIGFIAYNEGWGGLKYNGEKIDLQLNKIVKISCYNSGIAVLNENGYFHIIEHNKETKSYQVVESYSGVGVVDIHSRGSTGVLLLHRNGSVWGNSSSNIVLMRKYNALLPPALATTQHKYSNTAVMIDDTLITLSVEPKVINGRILLSRHDTWNVVCVRKVGAMFDDTNNIAFKTMEGDEIKHKIGDNHIDVNGVAIKSDVASVVIDGEAFIPVRMIADALGSNVELNSDTNTIVISKK